MIGIIHDKTLLPSNTIRRMKKVFSFLSSGRVGSLRSDSDDTEVVTEEGTHLEAREKRIHIFRIYSARKMERLDTLFFGSLELM
ncbi:hypothetical protein SAMN05421852_101369 [Thermoflavimicrobium dichotomicum]|uniref:Uncharacterized protein n=1 Tax=Thermoflavimicrobium dichotomicum TaxID=46223 RepID=A0A1I3K8S4_9BACL|nr:hypothetical protein SAMN05421852_101369 [Thermoflavimicrobium dichotomicum]